MAKFTSEQLDWIVEEFRVAASLAARNNETGAADGMIFLAGSLAAALQEGNPEFDDDRLRAAVMDPWDKMQ